MSGASERPGKAPKNHTRDSELHSGGLATAFPGDGCAHFTRCAVAKVEAPTLGGLVGSLLLA